MKVYCVIMNWSDFVDTETEIKVCNTKNKAIELVNNYIENDKSINDLYTYLKDVDLNEEIGFDLDYDSSKGYFYGKDGNNWCSIYILEQEIIEEQKKETL